MKKLIILALLLIIPGISMADHHEKAVIEMWKCELKDDQKMEDVEATNKRWLAMTRKTTGNDDVDSFMMNTVVGTLTNFVFADVYPDMATWAAVKSAEESEEGKAINAEFDALMECTDNRLFNSKRTTVD